MGLSVMIQSPIINILATSTALSKDWASFRLIRRFTLHMALVLTIITAVVSFTPLFTVVVEQLAGCRARCGLLGASGDADYAFVECGDCLAMFSTGSHDSV